jgi:hypothetical protein
MIENVNGFNYLPIVPSGNGFDSSPTSSTATTILSSIVVQSDNDILFGDQFRIKTLFRKGTAFSTSFTVSLYWNTGQTLNASAILLGTCDVGGTDSAIGLERSFYCKSTVLPSIIRYVSILAPSLSYENDIGRKPSGSYNDPTLNYTLGGYFMACAKRNGAARLNDSIICSYMYIDF